MGLPAEKPRQSFLLQFSLFLVMRSHIGNFIIFRGSRAERTLRQTGDCTWEWPTILASVVTTHTAPLQSTLRGITCITFLTSWYGEVTLITETALLWQLINVIRRILNLFLHFRTHKMQLLSYRVVRKLHVIQRFTEAHPAFLARRRRHRDFEIRTPTQSKFISMFMYTIIIYESHYCKL